MSKEVVDFLTVLLNGVTLAALYFIVASGFTLIFGLMRTTNMAHGSMYVLGAYVGVSAVTITGDWLIGLVAGFVVVAFVGIVIHLGLLARMAGQDLRQALVTIGLSIIIADLLLAHYGGIAYLIPPPSWAAGSVDIPWVVGGSYSAYPPVHDRPRGRGRRGPVADPQPDADRHVHPGRHRRPRHALGPRASTCRASSCSCSPSAPVSPASPA